MDLRLQQAMGLFFKRIYRVMIILTEMLSDYRFYLITVYTSDY